MEHLIGRQKEVKKLQQYAITKKYADNLRNKIGAFKAATNTRKTIFLTLITTHGLVQNQYSYLAQNELSMGVLFER